MSAMVHANINKYTGSNTGYSIRLIGRMDAKRRTCPTDASGPPVLKKRAHAPGPMGYQGAIR